MDRLRTLPQRTAPDFWGWVMVVASLPLVVYCLPLLSSGFDFWPAAALVRGLRYGDNVMFAYPLPIYLPFAPLGLLADSWLWWLAPAVSFGFLAAGLWLWGGRRPPVMTAALLSPVGLGVLVNSNFNTGVAIFGLGLAVWAKANGRAPLIGLGVALSFWRPVNCLPVLAVFLVSGWRWREFWVAVGAGLLFMVPLTALAFRIEPDWVVRYQRELEAIAGWSGIGPHLLYSVGPLAYGAAQVAIALGGMWVLRRRGLAAGAAFALALSTFLATDAGAYSGAVALPALILAAEEARYAALPAAASLVGWAQATVLLAINFPVGVVAYWFALQAYPLLRRAQSKVSDSRATPTEPPLRIRSAAAPK
jgi:hypothetical protein